MSANVPLPADLPPRLPASGERFWRGGIRALLRLSGWRLHGELPDCARLIVIGAPHSSWWDGVWGILMKLGMGADVRFMVKRELFRGPLGWLLRRLGGMPIDRRAAGGVVGQMVDTFRACESLWLTITPEGTRKPVERWKTGFWHIAHDAGVPVLPVAFDYPGKRFVVGPLFEIGEDKEADMARLREFYAPWQGRHHGL